MAEGMRIAVVNNIMPERLCRIILGVTGYEIAWIARDGTDAVKKCAVDCPDLLLIDPDLPGMDGVEATRKIMGETPCPILIVTPAIDQNAGKVFKAIGYGAVDAVNAPLLGEDDQAQRSRTIFLKKIKTIFTLHHKGQPSSVVDILHIKTESPGMSGVGSPRPRTDTFRQRSEIIPPSGEESPSPRTEIFRRHSELIGVSNEEGSNPRAETPRRRSDPVRVGSEPIRTKTEMFRSVGFYLPPLVVIGSSTGGPKTLVSIFSKLPKDLEAAIVVIQHLDQEFSAGLADWLNMQTPLRVRVAIRGTHPEKGVVDVAGTNDHLVLTAGLTFAYTPDPYDNPYRPSVDVFFRSVAKYWPNTGCAILLTGMGRDGAAELATLRSLDWYTIAQDQATSVVYGMPKAAKELDAATEILALDQIAPAILQFVAQAKQKQEKNAK